MKKLVLTAVASLACLAAFAQGKIGFQTDSLHLVYWGNGPLAGSSVNSDNMPTNLVGMSADLYMGTSASQLFLYNSTTFGALAAGPGKWGAASVQANANATTGAINIPGGTTVFVEVQIRSTEQPALNIFDSTAGSHYAAWGATPEFQFILGSSITYPVMWGSQNNGTWPVGTFPLDQYGAGSKGSIAVNLIPEPATATLAGLGAAALLIFRRRK